MSMHINTQHVLCAPHQQPLQPSIQDCIANMVKMGIYKAHQCTNYAHSYIDTHTHTYIQTYIHTYVHTYVHSYIHTYTIHTHAYIRTYTHIHTVQLQSITFIPPNHPFHDLDTHYLYLSYHGHSHHSY